MKLKKALKEIDKNSANWSDQQIESLHPEWQWRVCTARTQLGLYDWRGWQWRDGRKGHDPFDYPFWKLGTPRYPVETECSEPQKVGRLLIYSEQGIGDQIMFMQAIPHTLPYADEITVEVEPRLAPSFERSLPGFKIHGLKDLRDASWVKEPFDAKIMMGDVVARFIRDKKDFNRGAYLVPDPEKLEYWKQWLDDKPKVGFTFAGRQGYIDPYELPKEGINLQYGEWEPRREWITPPIDLKEDIEDVIAITANLERLISVANTNVHISGALGVPTDCILTPGEGQINNAVNYRYGMGSSCDWHGSLTIYRNFRQWQHQT